MGGRPMRIACGPVTWIRPCSRRQAERLEGLLLAAVYGLDPGPVDFRKQRASLQREAQDGALHRAPAELWKHRRQAEIDDEQDHQHRQPARHLDVGYREAAQDMRAGSCAAAQTGKASSAAPTNEASVR